MIESNARELCDGREIPIVGLGTLHLFGAQCTELVRKALDIGYRHIDTAELYENEKEIGEAIVDIDRDQLFITTKVKAQNLGPEDVMNAAKRSLSNLGCEYIDLYLIHWPNPEVPVRETLEAMRELVSQGLVRSIGLSNFNIAQLKDAMESGDFRLAATQLELNPYIEIQNIVDFARRRELCLIAYSPLARGRVSFDITLEHLGQRYGKSGSQVILRWLIQKGCVVIPKTTNIEHLRQNINIFDFSLDELEMAFIDNMVRQQKRAMAFGLES